MEAYSHVRLRKFNTKGHLPEQKLDNDLSMSVRAGNMVFLRGQVGQDLNGNMVGRRRSQGADRTGDAQREAAAGRAGRSSPTSARSPSTSPTAPIARVYAVVGKWLKGVYPVSTGLIVQGLARPEWVMEIDAWAVIPGKRMKTLQPPAEHLEWRATAGKKKTGG